MTLSIGDCRATLARWAAEGVRVQCVVTSPPYWGLRDYGTAPLVWGGEAACSHEWDTTEVFGEMRRGINLAASVASTRGGAKKIAEVPDIHVTHATCPRCGAWRGALGLEPTPELYVVHLVAVFRLVRDVLADDGTVWLNLGDSYNAYNGNRGESPSHSAAADPARPRLETGAGLSAPGLKPKDLVGIPWRVAFALQADGWYLRSDIIWAKPNPMPESVTDRPTKAHEYLFLLSKRERYFYDADAIREPYALSSWTAEQEMAGELARGEDGMRSGAKGRDRANGAADGQRYGVTSFVRGGYTGTGRNRRSVWTIATAPYPDAHFATFPPALVTPCILAGTSARGCCPQCGQQWGRQTARDEQPSAYEDRKYADRVAYPTKRNLGARYQAQLDAHPLKTVGWDPGCACGLEPVPAVVLDPFMGSGTVAQVAQDLGRAWLGCELSAEYAALCEQRTRQCGLILGG